VDGMDRGELLAAIQPNYELTSTSIFDIVYN
jgi:hypothetical protein